MGLIYAEQLEYMSNDQMQETHEAEIKLLNEVGKLASKYTRGQVELSELEEKLDLYIAHVKKHFEDEEKLMEQYDYPDYEMHKMAHDMFLMDLQYPTKLWKENGDIKKILHFIQSVPDWIVMHVRAVDAATANYITIKSQQQ